MPVWVWFSHLISLPLSPVVCSLHPDVCKIPLRQGLLLKVVYTLKKRNAMEMHGCVAAAVNSRKNWILIHWRVWVFTLGFMVINFLYSKTALNVWPCGIVCNLSGYCAWVYRLMFFALCEYLFDSMIALLKLLSLERPCPPLQAAKYVLNHSRLQIHRVHFLYCTSA